MGSGTLFLGHIIPGSFFAAFGIWWSFGTALRYIESSISRVNKNNVKYKATSAMPFICCPSRIKKFPCESIVKLVFTVFGMIIEIQESFKFNYYEPDDNTPIEKRVKWHFQATGVQHCTMYAAFLISAIIEILMHFNVNLPKKLDLICLAFAFSVQFLLFSFHLHDLKQLDTHIHVLLIIAIFGCLFSCLMEFLNPHNPVYTYARATFTILQGTWFWQIAFVLYPPIKRLENMWELENHQHIMFITASFCWHIILIILFLLVQLLIMNKIVSKRTNLQVNENGAVYHQLETFLSNNDDNDNLLKSSLMRSSEDESEI